MKQQLLLTLLAASMLLSTSCGSTAAKTESEAQTEAQTTVTETAAETETERPYYDTEGIDYNGCSFHMWNYDNININLWAGIPYDLFVDEQNGDILNDAVYNRNLAVEEKLNITISGTNVADANYTADLYNMVAAGEYGMDLMHAPLRATSNIINQNSVYDVNTINSFDFSQPWWNQNCNQNMTIHDKLFTVASDASFFDKLSSIVVFYNQQLANNYDLGDLYSMVEKGEWTLDKAIELGASVTADINGDGKYDQNDSVGISCQNDGSYYLMHAFGVQVSDIDQNGELTFQLNSERAMNALTSVYELMGDSSKYFNRQTYGLTLVDAINMFIEGRSLFMMRPLQSLFLMRDMNTDFGIIPLPKYEETQATYYSAVNTIAGTIGMIPRTAEDPERSAVVLSVLACESHYTVMNELYETVLGEKLIRDSRSKDMLDIVFSGLVFDPGLIWNFGDIQTTLLNNKKTDIASMIASTEKKVNKAIASFNAFIDEVE